MDDFNNFIFLQLCTFNKLKKLIFFYIKIYLHLYLMNYGRFFNVNLIIINFLVLKIIIYNLFMKLMNDGYQIIDFTRFRYIKEHNMIVDFIEYILEVNLVKNNKKLTRFYERTNSAYDKFIGKDYFQYLKYVSYEEYFNYNF